MAFNLPESYSQNFQILTELQFDTQQSMEQYLSMNEAFSGQPLRLTSDASLANTCQFNLTVSRRRRLESITPPLTSSNCSNNYSSVLIYFNGIGYSPNAAVTTIRRVQGLLSSNSSIAFDAGVIAVGAWRKDGLQGFLMGIITSYQLLLQQNGEYVYNSVELLSCLQIILNLSIASLRLPSRVVGAAFQKFRSYFVRRSIESFINYATQYNIARHLQLVIQQINEGKKVVLMAHAQGTLYANNIYNLLSSTQKRSVNLVYIAPTSSSMADGSNHYISNPNDYIIVSLRIASSVFGFPAPLAANMAATNFSYDSFGFNHDLEGYARAYPQQLVQLIQSARDSAFQPSRTMGSGPITIQLTWDSQPDVDLHIFEPNYHVYYGSRSGRNGYLDVDDTNGYGPQHYYTNCTISQGNYTVRANYFSGTGQSTATVTVSAGSEYYIKTFSLYPPRGSAGNSLPQYFICTIVVSVSSISNEYVYEIIHS